MTTLSRPNAEVPAADEIASKRLTASSGRSGIWGSRRIDKRYLAPILVTIVLLVGQLAFGFLESWSRTILAIATAIGVELVLARLFSGTWPHLASAYISGISVGMLVRSPAIWPYALCSAISITSKYVLRVDGRHIWNPSNFGIVAMLVLAADSVASLSVQWGNVLLPMVVVWCFGSVIIHSLGRFHITVTYVVSFVIFAVIRSAVSGHPFLSEVAPITGPMYQLFIFFMITDPKTTVRSFRGQCLVAFLVAAVEAGLRLLQFVHAPYYALFLVGPAANLVEITLDRRKRGEARQSHVEGAQGAPRRSGAGRGAPASDGDGGSGGAKPPGLGAARQGRARRSGAGRGAPASDGDGGSGGAKPPV